MPSGEWGKDLVNKLADAPDGRPTVSGGLRLKESQVYEHAYCKEILRQFEESKDDTPIFQAAWSGREDDSVMDVTWEDWRRSFVKNQLTWSCADLGSVAELFGIPEHSPMSRVS